MKKKQTSMKKKQNEGKQVERKQNKAKKEYCKTQTIDFLFFTKAEIPTTAYVNNSMNAMHTRDNRNTAKNK